MDAREMMDWLKGRFRTYSYYRFSLKGTDKAGFDELSVKLLDEMLDDEQTYFEFSKSNPVPAALEKLYRDLGKFSSEVLNFYLMFKQIRNF